MTSPNRLDQLVGADELQALADALSALAQVPIYFAQPDGRLATSLGRVRAACAAVLAAMGVERPCADCERRRLVRGEAEWPQGAISDAMPCPSGLVDVVVPVLLDGEVLGMIGTSQFRVGPDAAERARAALLAVGAAEKDVAALLDDTGEVARERLPQIQAATETFARILANFSRLRLAAERARKRAEHLLRTDSLTGIENRRQAMRAIDEVVSLAERHGRPFAFVMVDIDHFKLVNDGFGHAKGDEVLTGFAVRAAACLRPSDRIYRMGGEEFLIVCRETLREGALVMAERVRGEIASLDFGLGEGRSVTASFGLCAWDSGQGAAPRGEDVLRRADEALYEAKRRGRDRVVCAQ